MFPHNIIGLIIFPLQLELRHDKSTDKSNHVSQGALPT